MGAGTLNQRYDSRLRVVLVLVLVLVLAIDLPFVWSSVGSVDTRLGRLGVLLFDFGGGFVVDGRMKSTAIVEDFDVVEES